MSWMEILGRRCENCWYYNQEQGTCEPVDEPTEPDDVCEDWEGEV